MNAVALAVVLSVMPTDAPVVVWSQDVQEVRRMEVEGNDLLLTVEDRYEVRDASSGEVLGTIDNGYQTKLSAGRLLVAKGTYWEPEAIEAWNLRPFKLEWRLPMTERSGLGEIVGNEFYYGTKSSILRVSIPDCKVLDRRDLRPYEVPIQPIVFGNRVFFNYAGHEVYGLKADDLSTGWRNYSDCEPAVVDEFGCVATARLMWGLAIIGNDGKSRELEAVAVGGYTFSRDRPAVSKSQVITSASVYVAGRDASNEFGIRVLSPYLISFSRATGTLRWKVPMIARWPVMIGDRLMLFGANSPRGEKEWTLQVRDAADGKLLWKSKRIAVEPNWRLTANGKYAFEYNGKTLRALKFND